MPVMSSTGGFQMNGRRRRASSMMEGRCPQRRLLIQRHRRRVSKGRHRWFGFRNRSYVTLTSYFQHRQMPCFCCSLLESPVAFSRAPFPVSGRVGFFLRRKSNTRHLTQTLTLKINFPTREEPFEMTFDRLNASSECLSGPV